MDKIGGVENMEKQPKEVSDLIRLIDAQIKYHEDQITFLSEKKRDLLLAIKRTVTTKRGFTIYTKELRGIVTAIKKANVHQLNLQIRYTQDLLLGSELSYKEYQYLLLYYEAIGVSDYHINIFKNAYENNKKLDSVARQMLVEIFKKGSWLKKKDIEALLEKLQAYLDGLVDSKEDDTQMDDIKGLQELEESGL